MNPAIVARRLWTRFELLPFRYGMALVAGAITAVVLVATGIMALGGDGPDRHAAPTRPSPRPPVEAAAPHAPGLGSYAPPRGATTIRVPVRPSIVSTTPRPRPTHSSTPRPSPSVTCPTTLRKWSWMWQMCRHRQTG